jgi:FkbM family methyltransferase|tara:strand:+ start:86 stop:1006 length:921 start_codon:yes stop_codon:yes gene_type:complete
MSIWMKTIAAINVFLNAVGHILFGNRGNNLALRFFRSTLVGETVSFQHKMCPYTYTSRVSGDLRELYTYLRKEMTLEPWVNVAQSFIAKGDTVFDVGAHVGRHTIHFSYLCGTSGVVYAFEPERDNYEVLSGNIALNEISNCVILPLALSNKRSTATLHLNPNSNEGHSIIANGHAWSGGQHEHRKVRCETLDTVCSANNIERIRLVKIDVEGAHFLVLQGATRMLSNRRIDVVICEAGSNTQQISGRTDQDLLTFMGESGYSPFICVGDEFVDVDPVQAYPRLVDFIFLKGEDVFSLRRKELCVN